MNQFFVITVYYNVKNNRTMSLESLHYHRISLSDIESIHLWYLGYLTFRCKMIFNSFIFEKFLIHDFVNEL